MSDDTIAAAAAIALEKIGRPASNEEIFNNIIENGLYDFNTPTPKHVLEIAIKRRLINSPRRDPVNPRIFIMNPDNTYDNLTEKSTDSGQIKIIGPRRIGRAADKAQLIEDLMSEHIGVFKEIWRLILFAAQVGMHSNRREPLKSVDKGKGIDQSTFGNTISWPGILYLSSLVEVGDSSLLSGDREGDERRVVLFEEYANGGFSEMKEFFSNHPLNLDGLIAFIETKALAPNIVNEPDIDLSI